MPSKIFVVLWSERNYVVHREHAREPHLIADYANSFLQEFWNRIGKLPRGSSSEPRMACRWQAPPSGRLKLNVDASVRTGEGRIGIGDVIRDYWGVVVAAFSKTLVGIFSVDDAETLAVREGFSFVAQNGLYPSVVENDSLSTIQEITNYHLLAPNGLILANIKDLLLSVSCGSYRHVLHEGNIVAHMLATSAFQFPGDMFWVFSCSFFLSTFVLNDLVV
ncbi:Ribonuclease H-like domain containing protein [Trema orientale]|uniref:Ribonuclease H-like domain containing protein n=1 Tax=Trema orientale TaxID=63057 RepID=A0A2P5B751_TREOI|nr:Ribonuclease H-like domain containing protein [Trema orientale]